METKTAGEHTQVEQAVKLYDKILNSCTDKRFTEFSLPVTNGKFAIATNKMIACKIPLNLIETQECKTDEFLFSSFEMLFKGVYLKKGDEPKTIIQIDEVNRILNVCPRIETQKTNRIYCKECKGDGIVIYKYKSTELPSKTYEEEYNCPVCFGDGYGYGMQAEFSSTYIIDEDAIIKFGLNYFTMGVFSKILEASRLLENPVEMVYQSENSLNDNLFKVGEVEFLAMPFFYEKGVSRSTFYEYEF